MIKRVVTYEKIKDKFYKTLIVSYKSYGDSITTIKTSTLITEEEYYEYTRKDKI